MTKPEEIIKTEQLHRRLSGLDAYVEATRGLLLRRIGRRGAALLFFAVLDLVYAFSLYFPAAEAKRSSSTRFLADVAPLPVWGTMWLLACFACAVNAFRVNDWTGFAAAISIKTLWGLLHLVGALFLSIDRAWVSAAIWLCTAGWLGIISSWPEPPYRPKVRE